MGFRDDYGAARQRVDELERELAETRAQLEQTGDREPAPLPGRTRPGGWPAAVALGVAVLLFAAAFYSGFEVSGRTGEEIGIVLGVAGVAALSIALALLTLSRLLVVVPPNRLAVVSGRMRRAPDGSVIGYRLMRGGRFIRLPIVEAVDFLDLTNMVVDLACSGLYARGNERLRIEGTANVKVASVEPVVVNAVERFLGQSREEIARVARETLEGVTRGVIARLTVDEAMGDPIALAQTIIEESDHDMHKLGLVLDTVRLKEIAPE